MCRTPFFKAYGAHLVTRKAQRLHRHQLNNTTAQPVSTANNLHQNTTSHQNNKNNQNEKPTSRSTRKPQPFNKQPPSSPMHRGPINPKNLMINYNAILIIVQRSQNTNINNTNDPPPSYTSIRRQCHHCANEAHQLASTLHLSSLPFCADSRAAELQATPLLPRTRQSRP